jgi:NAD(P)-dependent dehydrogenase (short-subunit alcohol dehydrogenase family)
MPAAIMQIAMPPIQTTGRNMKSVLITGTSRGIGFEAALAFGRAGYKVHATMRNPSQSPELAATAAREQLTITVTAMDVNSDQVGH